MSSFSFSHLADHVLLRDFRVALVQHRNSTSTLLAYLAEIDARRLYLPAGYASMYLFCVTEFHMSEDPAFKRIRAARTARQFPVIFKALADGRLHVSAVLILGAHLTPENAGGLVAFAEHKTKAALERLLAERFPQPDVPTLLRAIPGAIHAAAACVAPAAAVTNLVPHVPACENREQQAPGPVGMTITRHSAPPVAAPPAPPARIAPLAPQRFALQVTLAQETHDRLRYAQALLGHAVPSGDVAQVLDRALVTLIRELEQRKFAATSRSRPTGRRGSRDERHVSASDRRTVWLRDGGQCTFVSDNGHRCGSCTRLEFDHVTPVARGGGQATAAGLRLRCRAHNQFEAERVFGARFMESKREKARSRPARNPVTAPPAPAPATAPASRLATAASAP